MMPEDARSALAEHCEAERRFAQQELAVATTSYRLLSVAWICFIAFAPHRGVAVYALAGGYLIPLFCLAYLWRLSIERFRSIRLLLDQNFRELSLKDDEGTGRLFVRLKEGLREIRED